MSEPSPDQIREQTRELLDSIYRAESGRILATLIRLLGDLDLAEEAMHEAFAAALKLWPTSGVPGNLRPWLISTARFKAIDTLRQRARLERALDASRDELLRHLEAQLSSPERSDAEGRSDEKVTEDLNFFPAALSIWALLVRLTGRNRIPASRDDETRTLR
jgi:RNA polymerase sigma-70 factor (ECF subfamily)